MSDTEAATPEAATPEAQEPTLEAIYAEANITPDPAPVPAPAPVAQTETPPISVPDPYDADGMKAYLAKQAESTKTLHQGLVQVASALNQYQMKERAAALKADIDSAVGEVNKVVNHPRPKVVEAMLDAEARDNPTFKALWDNRGKNPAAFNKALKVVAKKFASELDVKVDPKLVAAQEARRISQGATATTAPDPSEKDSWAGLSQADFDARWQQMISG